MPPEPPPSSYAATPAALAAAVRVWLATRANPLLDEFLRAWPSPPGLREVKPSAVPALRHLPDVLRVAPAANAELVAAVAANADAFAWRRSYAAGEAAPEFLENYGWVELVGPAGGVIGRDLACGLLLLGPFTTYPDHRHEAEELYVPLAGTAAWRRLDEGWTRHAPDSVIHHPRHARHAMRTDAEPLLAAYLWRSDNLAQKARLDPA